VTSAGRTLLVAGGLRVPNGLVLSPDGSVLYVAETVPNRILRMPVDSPGKAGPAQVFVGLPSRPSAQAEPDGMAVDTSGNLYVAHLAMSVVQVISPAGKLLRSIPAGLYDVSNLVFGGAGNRSLFITGAVGHRRNTAGRVFRVDLESARGISSLQRRSIR
jgi:gluconolactonase